MSKDKLKHNGPLVYAIFGYTMYITYKLISFLLLFDLKFMLANEARHVLQAEELEAQIKEEVKNRAELKKTLDCEKEQLHEVVMDTGESKSRLNSLMELQFELSNKLQITTLAKSNTESQLEMAISTREEMVREIEELRQHRDVLLRRIEFCKEKDVIGMVGRLTDTSCGFKKYTAEEIRLATNNFSERLRIKPGGDWNTTMYRGRINHATVAIKILNYAKGDSKQDFKAKVSMISLPQVQGYKICNISCEII